MVRFPPTFYRVTMLRDRHPRDDVEIAIETKNHDHIEQLHKVLTEKGYNIVMNPF